MMGGQPTEKSMDFKGSGKRLLAQMRPERAVMSVALALGVLSVALTVVGPKVLGHATDLIMSGIIGRQLPDGLTKAQAADQLRAHGQGGLADMIAAMPVVPGHGIDFGAVGRILLWVTLIYVGASLFGFVQARIATRVVQRTVFRLREQVEEKLARLPLSYFDRQQRGEVLSRATNDIDNIQQTLQQTLSQIVASLLTIVGVLGVMFWISWLLALVALVTVPVSVVVATKVGKRAQPQFVQQWKTTGKLNAHIEEMYTGHSLVKVFGRQRESAELFSEQNEALYAAGFRAQFISGIIQPAMMFIGNLNYVLVAVVGGLRVASGALSIGDVQAFIQYSGSSASRSPRSPRWPTSSSPVSPPPSGSSNSSTPRSRAPTPSGRPGPTASRAGSRSRTSPSATRRTSRSSRTCRWPSTPARRWRSSVRRAPARPPSSTS